MNTPQKNTRSLGSLMHHQLMLAAAIWWMILSRRGRMNRYGLMAMRHWQTHRRDAYRQAENPESFFSWMGEEIANRIATLTTQLAGPDLPGENYLDKAARLNNAKARATELAFDDFGLAMRPELTRVEWEETTEDHEAALISWAERMQEQAEGLANHYLTVEATSERFLLPTEFLERLISSPSPLRFLDDSRNRDEWEMSIERRWARDRMRPTE